MSCCCTRCDWRCSASGKGVSNGRWMCRIRVGAMLGLGIVGGMRGVISVELGVEMARRNSEDEAGIRARLDGMARRNVGFDGEKAWSSTSNVECE